VRLKVLVGEGGHVMGSALPFAVVGIAANLIWPSFFQMGIRPTGPIVGIVLLVLGVPLWIASVVQILVNVPRKRLITTGPFALVLHPIYTFVALLVNPGCGLLLDTWVGFAIRSGALCLHSHYSVRGREAAGRHLREDYADYRRRVLLPWL